jgi:hypothetical protein
MTVYAVITFHTTHFSLKAKKVLEGSGIPFETIPVPREFSSDCGFCCKVLWDYRQEVEMILRRNHVELDRVHRWERDEESERKRAYRFV